MPKVRQLGIEIRLSKRFQILARVIYLRLPPLPKVLHYYASTFTMTM